MRILIVSDMFPRDDNPISGVFVLDQVKALLRNGLDITVICPVPRFIASLGLMGNIKRGMALRAKRSRISGVEVASIPYLNLPLSIGIQFTIASMYFVLLRSIKRELNKRRVDIIHAHRVFPIGYVSMLISRKLGVPCMISAHGSDIHTHPQQNTTIRKLTSRTIEHANQLIAVSNDLAKGIACLGNPRQPIRVVYNGIDIRKFRPITQKANLRSHLGLPLKGIGIGYAGRLTNEKGIVDLVDAFRITFESQKDIWLLLVGDGPLKNWVKETALSFGISDRVHFAGQVSHDHMVHWMNSTDIFAMASHKEGASLVALEAMACALPIIATPVGIIPETVIEDRTGIIVPVRDAAALAHGLHRLASNENVRHRMGKAGRHIVEERYQLSTTTLLLQSIYKDLANERN